MYKNWMHSFAACLHLLNFFISAIVIAICWYSFICYVYIYTFLRTNCSPLKWESWVLGLASISCLRLFSFRAFVVVVVEIQPFFPSVPLDPGSHQFIYCACTRTSYGKYVHTQKYAYSLYYPNPLWPFTRSELVTRHIWWKNTCNKNHRQILPLISLVADN